MKNLKLDFKIILLNVAVMLVFVLAILFVYARVEFSFLAQKKTAVEHAVEAITGNITHLVLEAKDGLISTEEAQRQAIKLAYQTRNDEGHYFWINDMTPRMIMHPFQPELNGQDISDYRDPNGVPLFARIVEILQHRESGFVTYEWPKPGLREPAPKISYVRKIPEWGWVVGSGLYMDDIYAELAKIRKIFISVTLLVLCFALLMIYLSMRSISQPLGQAVRMIQDIGSGNLDSRLDLQRSDEVGIMATELNRFADNMQHEILAAFESLAAGNFTFQARGVIREPLEQVNRELSALMASKKKIAEDLEERNNTIKLLLNSTAEGVYGLDRDGRCLFCNESALKMLGYAENDLLGQTLHDLIAHTGPDGSRVPTEECLLREILTTRNNRHSGEGIFWTRDGEWISVEYHMHPLISDSQTVGAVVSFIDNSKKKQQLEQRIRTSQLAELGELAAGLAHEINNPISGVINYAQILLNRGSKEKMEEEILQRIIKEGDRIASIVQNLLSFAHKNRDTMVPILLQDIIREPLELVQQRLVNDGIFLDVDIEKDLPMIRGNAQKLEQVLLNLINNARHALNEKYPESNPNKLLRISIQRAGEEENGSLQLVVWDQGTGIPEINLSRIFTTFFTTKPAGIGTGLGLSITHDIIIEHDATIDIESEEGLYTKVTMEFPVFDKNSSALDAAGQQDAPQPAGAPH